MAPFECMGILSNLPVNAIFKPQKKRKQTVNLHYISCIHAISPPQDILIPLRQDTIDLHSFYDHNKTPSEGARARCLVPPTSMVTVSDRQAAGKKKTAATDRK